LVGLKDLQTVEKKVEKMVGLTVVSLVDLKVGTMVDWTVELKEE